LYFVALSETSLNFKVAFNMLGENIMNHSNINNYSMFDFEPNHETNENKSVLKYVVKYSYHMWNKSTSVVNSEQIGS